MANIRWKQGEQEYIRQLNKKVSSKKSRLKSQYGVGGVDIDTTPVKEIKTRKQMKAYMEKMESFINPYANKFNLVTTQGKKLPFLDVKKVEKDRKRVNREKLKEFNKIKDYEVEGFGGKKKVTVGDLADPVFGLPDSKVLEVAVPVEFDYNALDKAKLKARGKTLKEGYQKGWKKERDEMFRQSYLKSVDTVFLQNRMGRDLYNHVKNMGLDEFMKMYYTKDFVDLNFNYDIAEVEAKYKMILDDFGIEEKRYQGRRIHLKKG